VGVLRSVGIVGGVVALLLLAAGCGGSGGSNDGGGLTELVGTYTTTLHASDVPNDAPQALADGGLAWRLTILDSGGPDNEPALVIDSDEAGNLEAPSLRVEGDKLYLDNEECFENGKYVFYDNSYKWSLDGTTLTITPDANRCPDKVAETVLTSQPWEKAD
jgi:hypothetical protein